MASWSTIVLTLGAVLLAAGQSEGQTVRLIATLTGSQEVGRKDLLASGLAVVDIRRIAGGNFEIAFTITAVGTLEPTQQHIHRGRAGNNGPVVVSFPGRWTRLPVAGNNIFLLSGRVRPPRQVVQSILADPEGFYVNVHTAFFPDGAMRNQLFLGAASIPNLRR